MPDLDTYVSQMEQAPSPAPSASLQQYVSQMPATQSAMGKDELPPRPQWTDPNIPAQQRVQQFVEDHARDLRPWQETQANFKDYFPGTDPSPLKKPYEDAARLEGWRTGAKQQIQQQDWGYYLEHTAKPLGLSTFNNVLENKSYVDSMNRYHEGIAGDKDMKNIAFIERMHELQARESGGQQLQRAAFALPAQVLDTIMAGGALKTLGVGAATAEGAAAPTAARAALNYAGRTAATAAVMFPGQTLEDYQERRMRGESATEATAKSVGSSVATAAVLGTLGKIPESITGKGVGPWLARVGAGTGAGIVEQQAVDILASAAGLKTGYGVLGDLYRGENSRAAVSLVQQAAMFGTFSAMHAGHDHGEAHPAMQTAADALSELQKQGMSLEGAVKALQPAQERLQKILEGKPLTNAELSDPLRGQAGDYMREQLDNLQKAREAEQQRGKNDIPPKDIPPGSEQPPEGNGPPTPPPTAPSSPVAPAQSAPETTPPPKPYEQPSYPGVGKVSPTFQTPEPTVKPEIAATFKNAFTDATETGRPGEMKATFAGRTIYAIHDADTNTVRLDFERPGSTGVARGLETGSLDMMRKFQGLANELRQQGANVEYTAVAGRGKVYAGMMKRAGYEQVSGPEGEGNGSRVWQPKPERSLEWQKDYDDGIKAGRKPAYAKEIADENEAKRQTTPQGGTPAPEPGTGLINPVQTGVPGIVSGAVEVPEPKLTAAQRIENIRRKQQGLKSIESPAQSPVAPPRQSLGYAGRLPDETSATRELTKGEVRELKAKLYHLGQYKQSKAFQDEKPVTSVEEAVSNPVDWREKALGARINQFRAHMDDLIANPSPDKVAETIRQVNRVRKMSEALGIDHEQLLGDQLPELKELADLHQQVTNPPESTPEEIGRTQADLEHAAKELADAKTAVAGQLSRSGVEPSSVQGRVEQLVRQSDQVSAATTQDAATAQSAQGNAGTPAPPAERGQADSDELRERHIQMLADDFRKHDHGLADAHNQILRETKDALAAFRGGKRLAYHSEKYPDSTSVVHLDQVAQEMAKRYPGQLGADPVEKLFDMLKNGIEPGVTKAEARAQAEEYYHEQQEMSRATAATPQETEDVTRDFKQAGYADSAAKGEIARIEAEAQEEALDEFARHEGQQGAGGVGAGEEDFAFGHNVTEADPNHPTDAAGRSAIPGQETAPTGDGPTRTRARDAAVGGSILNGLREFVSGEEASSPVEWASGLVPAVAVKEFVQQAYEKVRAGVQHVHDELSKFGAVAFPATTRVHRLLGEALARLDAVKTVVAHAAPDYQREIFGNATPEQKYRLWSTFAEERARYAKGRMDQEAAKASQAAAAARAAGDDDGAKTAADRATDMMRMKNSVRSFVDSQDSALNSEQEFQDSLNSQEYKAFSDRYANSRLVKEMEANYRSAEGLDDTEFIDSLTQLPGRPMNMKVVKESGPTQDTGPGKPGGGGAPGGLANPMARKLGFAKKAFLSAKEYDLTGDSSIENTLMRGTRVARLADVYRLAQEEGHGDWDKPGQKFDGYTEFPNVRPPKGTQVAEEGQTSFYAKDAWAGELRQVLNVDAPAKFQTINAVNRAINMAGLMSTVEATSHVKNLLTMMLKPGMHPADFLKNAYKVIADHPDVASRMTELARIDAAKMPGMESGSVLGGKANPMYWTQRFLHAVDTTMRLTANDAFDNIIRRGYKVQDTETARRNFVNQLGMYSRGAQSKLVNLAKDTGIGPFAVGATNYYAQGLKTLVGGHGIATEGGIGSKADLALRGEQLAKTAAVLSSVALGNYLLWGNLFGDDKTPLGAMKVGTNSDGKTAYVDLGGLIGVTRGMRATGMLALAEGARKGPGKDNVMDKAVEQIVESLMHPAFGPPAQFAHTAYTGKNSFGAEVAQKVSTATTPDGRAAAARKGLPPAGSSQAWENVKAALANVNPLYATATGAARPGQKETVGEKASDLFGPFGLKFKGDQKKKVGQ